MIPLHGREARDGACRRYAVAEAQPCSLVEVAELPATRLVLVDAYRGVTSRGGQITDIVRVELLQPAVIFAPTVWDRDDSPPGWWAKSHGYSTERSSSPMP